MKAYFLFFLLTSVFSGCGNPSESGNNAATNSGPTEKSRVPASAVPAPKPGDENYVQDSQASAIPSDTISDKKKQRINQPPKAEKPFSKVLQSGKVSFEVYSKNQAGANNIITIRTKGFESINDSFTHKINGQVTHAAVADLNKDGFPELYVFHAGTAGNKEGDIIAYGSNRNMSATPVYVRHPEKNHPAMKGYAGEDAFYIKNNKLLREFAINADKSSKKQISYKLVRGESSLILEMDK